MLLLALPALRCQDEWWRWNRLVKTISVWAVRIDDTTSFTSEEALGMFRMSEYSWRRRWVDFAQPITSRLDWSMQLLCCCSDTVLQSLQGLRYEGRRMCYGLLECWVQFVGSNWAPTFPFHTSSMWLAFTSLWSAKRTNAKMIDCTDLEKVDCVKVHLTLCRDLKLASVTIMNWICRD